MDRDFSQQKIHQNGLDSQKNDERSRQKNCIDFLGVVKPFYTNSKELQPS